MDQSRETTVDAVEYGSKEPRIDARPMVAGGTLYDSGVANSAKPSATAAHGEAQCDAEHVEGGSDDDVGSGLVGVLPYPRPRVVGRVGSKKTSRRESVPTEKTETIDLDRMRYGELTELINSTPLGPVLNERQLYRHRIRSGGRFRCGRRVSLIKYVAWLVHNRHAPAAARSSYATGRLSWHSVLELIQRQQYCCALTGRTLTPKICSLDHIIPVSRGGLHRIENAQILHRDVNRAKGTLTNEEFLQLCREVVDHSEHMKTERGAA
jgi:5-methylcytosine-specific restriction endonuclease McrA